MSDIELNQALMQDDLVRDYLLENPDFFVRHGDLLKQLHIPHAERGTVSLVELQVKQLRGKIENLEQEITDLMMVARHNERIFNSYVDLLPGLLASNSFAELQHRLRKVLIGQLGLSAVVIKVNACHFDLGEHCQGSVLDSELLERVRLTRIGEQAHYFGRLTRGEVSMLFGDDAEVASVAMVPLGKHGELGLFLAASRDADHYVEGMDSLLLTQLCQVLSGLLLRLLPLKEN